MTEYEWLTCEDNHLRMLEFLNNNFEELHTLVVCTCPPVELHSKFTVWRCHIIREIVGNPFCLIEQHVEWLTNNVKSFAKGILESDSYDDVSALADILEESGCDNEELIRHFRQEVMCPECDGHGEDPPGVTPWGDVIPEWCPCNHCMRTGWLPKPAPCRPGCWALRLITGQQL